MHEHAHMHTHTELLQPMVEVAPPTPLISVSFSQQQKVTSSLSTPHPCTQLIAELGEQCTTSWSGPLLPSPLPAGGATSTLSLPSSHVDQGPCPPQWLLQGGKSPWRNQQQLQTSGLPSRVDRQGRAVVLLAQLCIPPWGVWPLPRPFAVLTSLTTAGCCSWHPHPQTDMRQWTSCGCGGAKRVSDNSRGDRGM